MVVRIPRVVPRPDEEPSDLIEVKEAAALLRIKPASVYRACKDGRLTPYTRLFDGKIMVRRSEVDRLARFRPPARDGRGSDERASEAG